MNLPHIIQKLIMSNNFNDLESLFAKTKLEEFGEGLLEAAFENKNLVPYSLVCMMLMKKEMAELHYLAAEILCLPLCHLEGAYASSLYHARRAIQLSPDDVSLKEFLLFFHGVPDKLITDEEARKVITEILEKEPENKTAKALIERLNKKLS